MAPEIQLLQLNLQIFKTKLAAVAGSFMLLRLVTFNNPISKKSSKIFFSSSFMFLSIEVVPQSATGKFYLPNLETLFKLATGMIIYQTIFFSKRENKRYIDKKLC